MRPPACGPVVCLLGQKPVQPPVEFAPGGFFLLAGRRIKLRDRVAHLLNHKFQSID